MCLWGMVESIHGEMDSRWVLTLGRTLDGTRGTTWVKAKKRMECGFGGKRAEVKWALCW